MSTLTIPFAFIYFPSPSLNILMKNSYPPSALTRLSIPLMLIVVSFICTPVISTPLDSAGLICDFEHEQSYPCPWSFEPRGAEGGFRVVAGKELTGKSGHPLHIDDSKRGHFAYAQMERRSASLLHNMTSSTTAGGQLLMIVSPYYAQVGTRCRLRFDIRMHGDAETHLIISQQLHPQFRATLMTSSRGGPEGGNAGEDGDVPFLVFDKAFPKNRIGHERWQSIETQIGTLRYPFRLQIEVSLNSRNSENSLMLPSLMTFDSKEHPFSDCSIDNIALLNCDENLYHEDVCLYSDQIKYVCPVSGECVPRERICDMTPDCPHGEDENETLHNCTNVRPGARCTFDSISESHTTTVHIKSPSKLINQTMVKNVAESAVVSDQKRNGIASVEEQSLMCDWSDPMIAEEHHGFHWRVLNRTSLMSMYPLNVQSDGFPYDHTFKNSSSGRYLFIKLSMPDSDTTHGIAKIRSPLFQAVPNLVSQQLSSHFQNCRLSFYYWYYGKVWSSIEVYIESPRFQLKQERCEIWRSSDDNGHVPGRWIRESQVISLDRCPLVAQDYYITIAAKPLATTSGYFLFDDISLTPQCFMTDPTSFGFNGPAPKQTPSSWTITSCGLIHGPVGPTQADCDSAYNQTGFRVKVGYDDKSDPEVESRGVQRLMIPKSGEYLFEVAGASGGTLPGTSVANGGALVRSVVNLTDTMEVEYGVGLKGMGPCDMDAAYWNERESLLALLNQSCNRLLTTRRDRALLGDEALKKAMLKSYTEHVINLTNQLSLTTKWPIAINHTCAAVHNHVAAWPTGSMNRTIVRLCHKGPENLPVDRLPGAAGGGASAVIVHDEFDRYPLIIAAGGGGAFWTGQDSKVGEGKGNISEWTEFGKKGAKHLESHVVGHGGGWISSIANSAIWLGPTSNHAVFQSLSGGDWIDQYPWLGRGGECSLSIGYNMSGGFGGGGASCGAGAGGGGGYSGGSGGIKTSGSGGWSYASPKQSTFEPGKNKNSTGYIKVTPCSKKCADGSICRFSATYEQTCICFDGRIADGDSGCRTATKITHRPAQVSLHAYQLAIIIALAIIFAAVILFLVYFVYHCKCKHLAKQNSKSLGSGALPLRQFSTGAGGSTFITEMNPTYEITCPLPTIPELNEIPRSCVTLIKALGQGAFGEVYEGVLNDLSGEPQNCAIAVKTLPQLATDQARMDFHMEALIMSKFNHQNIVRFIGVCFDKTPRLIVLELLRGGDLRTFLRENRPRPDRDNLCTADLLRMALDVAHGCHYLEQNHFIHRDIAARNCLLTDKSSERVVKIADFGMARDIYRNDYYRKGGKAMIPVKWMPPEAFLDGIFTSKTDVWSYGVLLWEIFSLGYMPYPGRGNSEVMQIVTAGGRLESPNGCTLQVYQIMSKCWHTMAEDRLSFSEIIEMLHKCLQMPDVYGNPLPIFYRSSASAEPTDGTSIGSMRKPSNNEIMTASFTTQGTGISCLCQPSYQPKNPGVRSSLQDSGLELNRGTMDPTLPFPLFNNSEDVANTLSSTVDVNQFADDFRGDVGDIAVEIENDLNSSEASPQSPERVHLCPA